MLTFFICITIGFILSKAKILPDNASKTVAKLLTWVFAPALNFVTMARYCTLSTLGENIELVLIGTAVVGVAMAVAIILAKIFIKTDSPERGIYRYSLAFANFGFLGDPLILAMFGDKMLFFYKLFTLPMSIIVYSWGLTNVIPKGKGQSPLKSLMNAPFIAMLIGIIVGLTGLGSHLPEFATATLDSLKSCLGPMAMLLAGITVARYSVPEMLANKKVYVATALRLAVLPAAYIGFTFLLITLLNGVFSLGIPYLSLYLLLFAYAGPLGLNTIVFPEAYGGNPKTGASMALVSHTLCIITIPLMYAALVAIFGVPTI